jgi:uncharacterized RDD family membrane protein YckC
LLTLVVLAAMAVDGLTALFRKDRRSLHDVLVRTQVVLDAEPRATSRPAPSAG